MARRAPLTRKILDRPRLMERIRQAIPDLALAHMSCFTVTELERRLALRLGLPIYGCDPSLTYWGTKSGSRRIFKEAGIELPAGFENLEDAEGVSGALSELKQRSRTCAGPSSRSTKASQAKAMRCSTCAAPPPVRRSAVDTALGCPPWPSRPPA